jgi:hypothetical protein
MTLPVIVDTSTAAGTDADAAAEWAAMNRATIEALLNADGAVLIRGFDVVSPQSFRAVCAAVRPDLANYRGGDSPRISVADQVYTSSEYASDQEVLLHNELSYAGWSPNRVFFCCVVPSETGGETHLADGRQIYSRLDPAVRSRFEARGVTYLQHLWDAAAIPGIGKSWQETFETGDRGVAEAYLKGAGMDIEWTGPGLRTAAHHAAVVRHNVNGQRCWHNQADQWHRDLTSVKVGFGSGDDPRIEPSTAGIETLGNHVTFGDGTEIALEDLLHVREVSREREVLFQWQVGDILALDNVSTMHGRKPFTGERLVLAAMA